MTAFEVTSIGQVLEATVRGFVFGLHAGAVGSPPALGSVVATGDAGAEIYGVVVEIETAGIDGRRPDMRGPGEDGHEQALRANPHLRQVLETTCEALVVAHRRDGRAYTYLPPAPPRIWDGVAPCPPEERARLAADLDVLRPLVAEGPAHDDAAAAFIRALADDAPDPRAFRVEAGKALARLLAADPPRLTALLRRIRPDD